MFEEFSKQSTLLLAQGIELCAGLLIGPVGVCERTARYPRCNEHHCIDGDGARAQFSFAPNTGTQDDAVRSSLKNVPKDDLQDLSRGEVDFIGRGNDAVNYQRQEPGWNGLFEQKVSHFCYLGGPKGYRRIFRKQLRGRKELEDHEEKYSFFVNSRCVATARRIQLVVRRIAVTSILRFHFASSTENCLDNSSSSAELRSVFRNSDAILVKEPTLAMI